MNRVMLDTNILLSDNFNLEDFDKVTLSTAVLEELDGLKKAEGVLGFKARKAIRQLENSNKVDYIVQDIYDTPNGWDANKRDNQIVMCAKENNAKLFSNDLNVRVKANSIGVECEGFKDKEEKEYLGYKELYLDTNLSEDNDILSKLYEFPEENTYDLKYNEYLVVYDKSRPIYDEDYDEVLSFDVIDKFKWDYDEDKLIQVRYKPVSSKFLGKVKPRNIHQELLFDMMQDSRIKIKLTTGSFGTGKDFCQIVNSIDMIERNKFDKLVWVRNVVEVANSGAIGFLPGSANEKLLPYAMPLADKLGGVFGLEMMIRDQKIELQHLSTIRGRDFKNCIVYCTEVENMSKEHIQLLIGRIGEGSILVLNGDLKQIDKEIFKTNSGLKSIINKLSGHPYFGFVKLQKTERSEIAAMADLLD